MRIAIFGVGAMACLFGAKLSPHSEVRLIGSWPEQLAALQATPLRIIAPDGREEHVRLSATNVVMARPRVDIALILTKFGGTEKAAGSAAQILKPDGVAITLQNGLGNLEILQQYVDHERATLGVTMQGAALERAGVLRLGGNGPTTLAVHPAIQQQVENFAEVLKKAGFEVALTDNIEGLVWGKLAVNAAINPLTALLTIKNGKLLDSEWTHQIMREAALEVQAVAAAQGIQLPFDAAEESEQVARNTAANRSSMLQDIARGAATEIEAICGAVVQKGHTVGIATPVNAMLYKLIRALESLRKN